MTLKETAGVLALLREYYPRDITSTDFETKVKAWHLVLSDYPFDVVKAAAVTFAAHDTKGFMPTPGQLVAKIQSTQPAADMTAQEAWVLVDKAVRGLDFMAPEKAFDKLPEPIQRAVGSPSVLKEWAMGNEDEFMTVIYSQFLKAFAIHQQRQRELAAIPASVRSVISGVADRMALGDGV